MTEFGERLSRDSGDERRATRHDADELASAPARRTEQSRERLGDAIRHANRSDGPAATGVPGHVQRAPGIDPDAPQNIQRDVFTEAAWETMTTKYRSTLLGWEYGRTDLFRAIDKALQEFHKARKNWRDNRNTDLATLPPAMQKLVSETRPLYVDTTFELQRAILEWQADKTKDDGTMSSIRRTEVAQLLVEVQAEIVAIKATPEHAAMPAATAAWGAVDAFSDAGAHDPADFRYIINGITPGTDYREQIQADPALFNANAGIISVSVIDQAKNSVWAPSGYIMKLPSTSIIAAAGKDLASNSQLSAPNTTMDQESDRLNTKFGTLSPAQMTAQTPAGGHNEAAVKRDGLEVTGIFVVQDPTAPGTPVKAFKLLGAGANGKEKVERVSAVSAEWMTRYQGVAAKIGIPIVWLSQSDGAVVGAFKSMNMIPLSAFDPALHELVGDTAAVG